MRTMPALLAVCAACGPAALPEPMMPPAPAGPTYHQDVAPLLSESCSGCHVAGGIAPFALTTYADAKLHAAAISAATASRSMPPWMPGGATPPLRHDSSLSDAQVQLLAAWAEAGAPEGDAATAAPLVPPAVVLFESPDLSFDIGHDYVPDATLADEYRCFAIPLSLPASRMATAYRVTPGNRKIVHHVIVSLFEPVAMAELQQLDAASPGPGWQCFGGPVPATAMNEPVNQLGSWVPGMSAVAYVPGTANRIIANAIAVVQIHYNLAGGTDPDRTRIEVKLAAPGDEASLQQILTVRLLRRQLAIPPNTMGHLETSSFTARQWTLNRFYPDGDGYVLGVAAHAHTKATRMHVKKNGETLLDIPRWNFHWQGGYQFVNPVKVLPTDMLTIECTYDNPTSSMVTWGEGTDEEMCIGYLQVVDRAP